ncbi:MAG: methyltransferase domain-containing protein [Caldilineaceae bacterium]
MNYAKNTIEWADLKFFWLRRIVQTMLFKQFGKSHTSRWANANNLFESWDTRTKMLASFIPPNSTVLEFGAGRMMLRHYLPEGCQYTPSDIVDRGQNTLVCDLNAAHLPPFPFHDVIVFGGVLEYVHDLQRLIAHVATSCEMIVASYAVADLPDQSTTISRRRHGWVNDWNSQALQALFLQNGFACEEMMVWEMQHLFKFVMRRSR